MPPRIVTEGNVTRLHREPEAAAPQQPIDQARVEVARYIGQMVLDLERMANTANLDLLSYFLAMARAEADGLARLPSSEKSDRDIQTQAPYRAD